MDAVRHLGDVVLHTGVADVIHGKMLLVPVKCLTLPVVAHVRIADYRRSILGDTAVKADDGIGRKALRSLLSLRQRIGEKQAVFHQRIL